MGYAQCNAIFQGHQQAGDLGGRRLGSLAELHEPVALRDAPCLNNHMHVRCKCVHYTNQQSQFRSEALRSCCSRRRVQAPIARVSQGSDREPRTKSNTKGRATRQCKPEKLEKSEPVPSPNRLQQALQDRPQVHGEVTDPWKNKLASGHAILISPKSQRHVRRSGAPSSHVFKQMRQQGQVIERVLVAVVRGTPPRRKTKGRCMQHKPTATPRVGKNTSRRDLGHCGQPSPCEK